jgi:hypothetical protein
MARAGFLEDVRPVVPALLVACLLPSLALGQVPAGTPNEPTLTANLEDPGHALSPGGNETIALKVGYTPGAASVPGPLPDTNDPSETKTAPTQITFEVKAKPSWVENVTFVPSVAFANITPGQRQEMAITVVLHMAPDAPAQDHQNLSVVVHAAQNGATAAKDAESPMLMLRPDIVPRVKVELKNPGLAIVKGGQWQPIAFLVTNTGNGQLTARLNVTAAPQDSIVDAPPTVTLAAGETQTIEVLLKLPWTYGESGALTLEATPLAGEAEGRAVHADAEIAGQSAVPDVAPLLAVGLVGLLALLRRR